jgi:hypothetical protein
LEELAKIFVYFLGCGEDHQDERILRSLDEIYIKGSSRGIRGAEKKQWMEESKSRNGKYRKETSGKMNSRKSKSKTSKVDKNLNGKIMKFHKVKAREKKLKRFKGRNKNIIAYEQSSKRKTKKKNGGKREVCTKPAVSNTCLQVLKQSLRIRNTFRDVPL